MSMIEEMSYFLSFSGVRWEISDCSWFDIDELRYSENWHILDSDGWLREYFIFRTIWDGSYDNNS